jgi:hypothetical protein
MPYPHFLEPLESRRLLSISTLPLLGSLKSDTTMPYRVTSQLIHSTFTTTIKGPATFNGHRATEQDMVTSVSPRNLSKDFVGFDSAGNMVSYGGTLTTPAGTSKTTNTPAAILVPARMSAGTTYTFSWSSRVVSADQRVTTTSTVHKTKLISEKLQTVKVPAGTFKAYPLQIIDITTNAGLSSFTTRNTEWLASGKGLVKFISSMSGVSATSELMPTNVVIGRPTKLIVAQQPATGAVNELLGLRVDVTDGFGFHVAGDSSSITLSIASGPAGGKLSGPLTKRASSGLAAFSDLRFSAPGTYVLRASASGLIAGLSQPIVITSSQRASKLAFLPGSGGGVIGRPVPVFVGVETAANGLVTTDSSRVTLSVVSGPDGGVLAGTTSVNALKGVAIFSNLSFTRPGKYTIRATDGDLTPALSEPFMIVAGSEG